MSEEIKQELLNQLFEIGMRINLETQMACWIDVAGHVDQISIKVSRSKEKYQDRLTSHSIYYKKDYESDQGLADFKLAANIALEDLKTILVQKFDKKYIAYCNLIDMSCNQPFTSEAAAKQWVKKMKRKYDKVHAIVGYTEEFIKTDMEIK
jgi:hypothetical protein